MGCFEVPGIGTLTINLLFASTAVGWGVCKLGFLFRDAISVDEFGTCEVWRLFEQVSFEPLQSGFGLSYEETAAAVEKDS